MPKYNEGNINKDGKKGNYQVERSIKENAEINHRQKSVPSRATSSEPSNPPKK